MKLISTNFLEQQNGGPFEIACPVRQRVRIVSMVAFLSGVATGDQVFVIYRRSNAPFVFAAFPPLQGAESTVCAAIGIQPVPLFLSSIDPVTGLTSYTNLATQCTALPQSWFDFDVTALFSTAGGLTFTSARITYEREVLEARAQR